MKSAINHDGQQAGISPAPQESAGLDQSSVLVRGFSTKTAAEYIGVSESYLKSARKKNKPEALVGPKFTKIGSKIIYLREDLEAYLTEAKESFYSA